MASKVIEAMKGKVVEDEEDKGGKRGALTRLLKVGGCSTTGKLV